LFSIFHVQGQSRSNKIASFDSFFVSFYFINSCKQTNSEFIDLRQKPQKDKQSKQAELRPLLESVVIENLKNQI
jgi:hypothetical protein